MNTLHVETLGRGSIDLALLHGWGLGKFVWTPLVEKLDARYRLHLVSLPGYNQSATPINKQSSDTCHGDSHKQTHSGSTVCRRPIHATPEIATFEETANALAGSLPAGCILCAWSLGSLLALQAALSTPAHFSRLILVGSTPRFTQSDNWPHAQPAALLSAFRSAVASNAAGTLQRFAVLLNQKDTRALDNIRHLSGQAARIPDHTALAEGLQWLHETDLRARMRAIRTPTLLIHGEHDPLMPLAAAQCLAQAIPEAKLEVFTGAGHAPFLHDPEHFAQKVDAFCHDCHVH